MNVLYVHDDDDDDVRNSTVIMRSKLIKIEALIFLVEIPEVLECAGVHISRVKGNLQRLLQKMKWTRVRRKSNPNPAVTTFKVGYGL